MRAHERHATTPSSKPMSHHLDLCVVWLVKGECMWLLPLEVMAWLVVAKVASHHGAAACEKLGVKEGS